MAAFSATDDDWTVTDPKFAGLGTMVVSTKFAVVNLPELFDATEFDETADEGGDDEDECDDEGVILYVDNSNESTLLFNFPCTLSLFCKYMVYTNS